MYSNAPLDRRLGAPEELIPIISYARISADRAEDAHGVANQHRENTECAPRFGAVVVCEMTDNNRPASKDIYREEFEVMIKSLVKGQCLCHGRKIAGVIAVEQPRIARKHGDWERFTDALTSQSGRVYIQAESLKDPYSEGFAYEGTIGMIGAKAEPKKIAARVTRHHRNSARDGKPASGRRCFGWTSDGATKHPEERQYAEKMIEMYLNGSGVGAIVRHLQQEGSLTTTGKQWRYASVRAWLENPKLCGWRRYGRDGEIVTDHKTGLEVVGKWETYCTPEQWLGMYTRLTAGKGLKWDFGTKTFKEPLSEEELSTMGTGKARKYLLSGFLRCGTCYTRLTTGNMPSRGGRQYRCRTKANGGCGGVSRNAEKLEAYVVGAALTRAEIHSQPDEKEEPWPDEHELEKALEDKAALLQAWNDGEGTIPAVAFYSEYLPKAEARVNKWKTARRKWLAGQQRQLSIPVDVWGTWERNKEDITWCQEFLSSQIEVVIVKKSSRGPHFSAEADHDIIWKD
jgi:DNA invertase Pin-like site-specific DNA recombinase